MSFYRMLLAVLLWQFWGKGEKEMCTIEKDLRQQPTEVSNEFFIQYCSEGSWHYLCNGGTAWTNLTTLAAVTCRQVGYSDQGSNLSLRSPCLSGQEKPVVKGFRINPGVCTGIENNLTECGTVQTDEICPCGTVAVITCLAVTHTEEYGEKTTAQEINNQPTTVISQKGDTTVNHPTTNVPLNSHNSDTTVTLTEIMSPTMTLQEPNTSTTIPVLAAVIGVLVGLVTVALIVVCLVVVCKKRSTVHKQSCQGPPTRKNESCSLRQLDDPVYDEASSTQPNYSSLGPTYEMEAANVEVINSDHMVNTPQDEPVNPTPARMETSGNDFYDAEQHTYAVVNADKKKKAKIKTPNSTEGDNDQQEVITPDTPANCMPAGDVASKEGDGFYDAEEHTYSVVNVKGKKKTNKKSSEDSREGKSDED